MRKWVMAAVAVAACQHNAVAETLTEAMSAAYDSNPQLLAERSLLRATDESVPQALAGWRPTVQFTGSWGPETIDNTPGFPPSSPTTGTLHPGILDLSVTQNVYNGGRTVAQTAQAENSVRAERARAVATESLVLFSVAQAYFDILRDQTLVALNVNNEQVLRRQLEATRDEFSVANATLTDVAQAEARLAAATASRQQAEGTLDTSRAEYAHAVGREPENLERPSLRPVLPENREQALALAGAENPTLVAAVFTEDAALENVQATRAQLLPNINIIGDVNRGQLNQFVIHDTVTKSVIARLTVPLYEGGAIYSQTRQAQETLSQRKGQTDDARRQAIQSARAAWDTIQSARASVQSLQTTIRAATIALDGVRTEQQVGERTVLDVLNAEQELFSDRVSLEQSQHDLAVAEFNLAQQIGRLTATDLKLPVKLYDVDVHYDSVRDQLLGFGSAE